MARSGPKGKYEYWLTGEGLMLLSAWARDGLTEESIAEKCGIARSTLSEWKNKHKPISDALKRGKEPVDIEVENAMLKLALGYYVPITKHYKLKKVLVKDGVRQEVEELKEVTEQIYIAPVPVNQFFWLKNRKPSVWRDKQRDELEGKDAVDDGFIAALSTQASEVLKDGDDEAGGTSV